MQSYTVNVHLAHQVDVSAATEYLVRTLGCESWHVACRQEHALIVQLTRGTAVKYAVCYECTPAVEKAIYHGSRAWSMSIIPLQSESHLEETQIRRIEAGLAELR